MIVLSWKLIVSDYFEQKKEFQQLLWAPSCWRVQAIKYYQLQTSPVKNSQYNAHKQKWCVTLWLQSDSRRHMHDMHLKQISTKLTVLYNNIGTQTNHQVLKKAKLRTADLSVVLSA